MTKQILLNSIRTPDGTVLVSRNRHDYRTHEDKNGEQYMVDGGNDYLRRWVNIEPYEELSVYYEEGNHDHNRSYCSWGTFGKNGDEPYRTISVVAMETDHIKAVLETQNHMNPIYRKIMEEELKYREENGIRQ